MKEVRGVRPKKGDSVCLKEGKRGVRRERGRRRRIGKLKEHFPAAEKKFLIRSPCLFAVHYRGKGKKGQREKEKEGLP